MPASDADAWRELLRSPLLRELQPEPPQPDRFVYRVVHPRARASTSCAAEQQLPVDVRDLLERTLREQ